MIEGYRLSAQQKRLWLLQQADQGQPYWAQCSILIEGQLYTQVLKAAVQHVVDRHEILRTTFRRLPELTIPLQVIHNSYVSWDQSHNLSDLNAQEQEARIEALFCAMRQMPFDFEQDPLLRLSLITLAPRRYILLVGLTALCSDIASLKNLVCEISRSYAACSSGEELSDEPLQYADFSGWQNELFEAEYTEEERTYWSKQDIGDLLTLQLPFEHHSPDKSDFRPQSLSLAIHFSVVTNIEALAQEYNTSSSVFLLTCWTALFWRLMGQSKIVIGTAFSGRKYEGLEEMLGIMAKYLPIHCHIDERLRFDEFVKVVGELMDKAYEWQEYFTGEEIDGATDHTIETSFFPICFDFEEQYAKYFAADVSFVMDKQYTCIDRFKIKLSCVQKEDALIVDFHYDSSVFSMEDTERLAGLFHTLLQSATTDPKTRISELKILSDVERHQLLVEFNNTRVPYLEDACVHQLFEAQVAHTPDSVAVVCADQHLSYAALDARASRLALLLRARGVAPDLPVALCLPRAPVFLIALLAVLKAGGAFLPLDPHAPQARLAFLLHDSAAPLLLSLSTLRPALPAALPPLLCLDLPLPPVAPLAACPPRAALSPAHLAYILYTSGSTGSPKAVMVPHRALVNYLLWAAHFYPHASDAGALLHSPLTFDLSLTALFVPLLLGLPLLLLPDDADLPALLAALQTSSALSLLKLTPTHLALLGPQLPPAVARIRSLILGGEALHGALLAAWRQAAPASALFNEYGPTETVVGCCVYRLPPELALPDAVPIGRPIANTQLYLLDPHMQPVPVGVAGELFVGGDGLARGYLRRPDLTAERFLPNPFAQVLGDGCWVTGAASSNTQHPSPTTRLYRTGDYARYRADGVLDYLGRRDEQVKLRGFRIELGEIETVLRAHPLVRQAAVALASGPSGQPTLVAYLVPRAPALSAQVLHQFVQAQLPTYMRPTSYVLLPALPLNPSGKLDRRALPPPSAERLLTDPADHQAPRTPTEALLAQIWASVLGRESIGVQDNFFALGGDSILSLQIIARANQAGVQLTPKQLFQYPTISQLAALAGTSARVLAPQGRIGGPVPLTPIQCWFFAQELPNPQHYNQALLFTLRQPLLPTLLAQALRALLAHHDALRLRFVRTETGWQQLHADREETRLGCWFDLSGLAGPAQRAALEETAAALQRSLDLRHGPLLRVALFTLGQHEGARLLLLGHHLVVDGVTWRILLNDLQSAYAQLVQGQVLALPPKTTSFQQWAERLQSYAGSAALRAAAAYWLAAGRTTVGRLPRERADGANTQATARMVEVGLSVAETEALLREVPAVYHTQISEVLLTALAQVMGAWTGEAALLVELEGHGREELFAEVDLTRTVGWFTALYPVLLDLSGVEGAGAALKAIKEQVRAVPQRGLGYGVLRYLGADAEVSAAVRALPEAEVSFNYLGQVDQLLAPEGLFGPARESSGPTQSTLGQRSHLLEINSMIAGGRLRLAWTYSAAIHQRATIERLAQRYLAALRALIAHCQTPQAGGFSPSDFPLAALDQSTLDRLVGHERLIEDIYPLSPMQQGILFHTLYAPESGVYVNQLQCTFRGKLDSAAFARAWQQVVDRHSVLRTAFVWEGVEEPLQIVYSRAGLPLEQLDWRDLAPVEQARRLDAYAAQNRDVALTQAPLMRLAVIHLAEEVYQFVWSQHHLLTDGWSTALVLNEVLAHYAAFAQGQEIRLAQSRPYREYIAWLQEQDLIHTEAFWRQRLQGVTAPTPLGADRSVGSVANAADYAEQKLQLAKTTTAALHALVQEHGLTLNTAVQGAWALLLSRYSGADDVIFGVTVAGRPTDLPGVETMVGLFINTLPVRIQVTPAAALVAWLQQVQDQQVELRQYEYSPLVAVQGWSDMPHDLPLFESIVVFENYPVEAAVEAQHNGPDLAIGNIETVEQTNYPLVLVAVPGPAMALRLNYDGRRFDAATITRMLGHVETLLEVISGNPEQRVAEVSLLNDAERQQLLVEWNATTTPYPHDQCIHHLFAAQAARTPDAVALVYAGTGERGLGTGDWGLGDKETRPAPSGNEGRQGDIETKLSAETQPPTPNTQHPTPNTQQLTYDELDNRANQLAHHLQALGVGPEMRVGLCLERSLELVIGMLGILKAGGAYVPLDPTYPPERLAFMLHDAQMLVLLTLQYIYDLRFTIYDLRSSDEQVQELNTQHSTLNTPVVVCIDTHAALIARQSEQNPGSEVGPENLAYLIYTSGTTGRPKAVMVEHRNLVNVLWASQQHFQFQPHDIMPWIAPVTFDIALFEVFNPLLAGGTAILLSRQHVLDLPRLVADLAYMTVIHTVPSLMREIVRAISTCGAEPRVYAHMRMVFTGGDVVPPDMLADLRMVFPSATIYVLYGPTEGTIICTHYRVPAGRRVDGYQIGTPLSNITVRLYDQRQQLVPIGVPGELYIGGAGITRGYWQRPDLTAERFIPNPFAQGMGDKRSAGGGLGWVMGNESSIPHPPSPIPRLYRTGDRARYLPDGTLEFLGRIDEQVKVRGFRIEPGEVEAVLRGHSAVREAVVLAREDAPGDKRLVAYVVTTNDQRPTTNDQHLPGGDSDSVLSPQSSVLGHELHNFLKEKLPDYMVPAAFVVLKALALTPNGKVDRQALPAPDTTYRAHPDTFVTPRTPVEELLTQIWADVLRHEQVSVHDNFFALGGHSLLATQVISRMRETFQIELPLRSLFEAPTVAESAERIATAQREGLDLRMPPLRPIPRDPGLSRGEGGALPLSFAQQRLWFLDQMQPNSPIYNMPAAVRLIGSLNVVALQQSLSAIVQRHQVLRTTFVAVDGQPVQVIAPARPVPLPLLDLQALPEEEQKAGTLRLASAEARQPFDLARDSLVRVALLRLNPGEHVALLTMHHIVSDGWSVGVFITELATLYASFSQGHPVSLPDLPIQYGDFAVWQRNWLRGEVLAAHLNYWREQLAGLLMLQLPTDRPRQPIPSFRGASQGFVLSSTLSAELVALSRRENVTLFMTSLAVFQVLLARYSGQDDIAVGTDVANRTHAETEGLIGFFVNQLVLRTDLSGNPSFREMLQRVREITLDAYTYQDLPFEYLVKELNPERSLNHAPLFQVKLILQNAPVSVERLAGLSIEPLGTSGLMARFDLVLSLAESEDRLTGELDYSTELFDPATIERLLTHFEVLLEQVVTHPERRLTDLPFMTLAERQQLLVDWNATETSYPHDQCIHHLFEAQVARTPNAVAVLFDRPQPGVRGQGSGVRETSRQADKEIGQIVETRSPTPNTQHPTPNPQQLTYAELNRCANQLAHHLRASGVGPEVLVAVCVERSLELIIGLLGILKAGGAYLPLDLTYPHERLTFMLEDSRAPVLLTQARLVDDLPAFWAPVIRLDADAPLIGQERCDNPRSAVRADNLAYVIYTSGSTGTPKGVQVPHRGLGNLAAAQIAAFGVRPDSRVLQFAALSFDASVAELWMALLAGATLVLPSADGVLVGPPLAQFVREQAITTLTLPPSALATLPTTQLPTLRTLVVAGEACPAELGARWTPGRQMLNAYGPTEATVCATISPAAAAGAYSTIGRPIANAQVYVLDRQLQPVPIGVPGELHIGGVGLARGYLNRPDLTAAAFVPNPFGEGMGDRGWGMEDASPSPIPYPPSPGARLYRTGDRGRYRQDGSIEFLGRNDHQVKVRGFRIELGEIETALGRHAAVREVVVLAREDAPDEKRLVAYVVPTNDQRPTTNDQRPKIEDGRSKIEDRRSPALDPRSSILDPRSSVLSPQSSVLRAFLQAQLPAYMVPAAFVFLSALPLTPNGKVDRRALPAPDTARPNPDDSFTAPCTPVEVVLAQIWAAVLRREHIGVHDNFFALGGDSILSLQIIARAHQAGLYFTARQLFQYQTIAQLAAVADTAAALVTEQGLVTGPVPLTPIQHWFFAQDLPAPHHYNQTLLLEVRQPLDPTLLTQAVHHLLRHHDALRLRFVPTPTGWQQRHALSETNTVVSQFDLAALPIAERSPAIEAVAAQLQRSLDLRHGPLVRVALFALGQGEPARLLLIFHHLVVDGVAWRILLEDLQTAYGQLQQGQALALPPKTSAFQQWATRLHTYATDPAIQHILSFWLALSSRAPAPLPQDFPHGANTLASARVLTVALTPDETRALLQDVPTAYHTQINDVLLTALVQALAPWSGGPTLLLDLEGHGREELFAEVDLTRTVGWFTTLYPVLLDLSGVAGAGAALKAIKEQVRAVPQRGLGYGVLRYLCPPTAQLAPLRALPAAEVSFNYLGQVDQLLAPEGLFGPAREACGPSQHPAGRRSHLLEVSGLVLGGRLRLAWTYSAAIHQRATIERLAQRYLAALRALIAHCQTPQAGGFSPSDFPLAALDQSTLDRLLGADRQVEALYPLAPLQHGLLFHALQAPHSGVYVAQLSCTLHGELHVAAFAQAWQQVLARHPSLRTAFVGPQLPTPLQLVRPQVALPWESADWQAAPEAVQSARLTAYREQVRTHGLDLATAPLLRLALFQLAPQRYAFVWTWHHLVLDGWSVTLVLNEVFACYEAARQGQALQLAAARPYQDYIAWLQQREQARAEVFWRQQLHDLTAPTTLDIDHPMEQSDAMSYAEQHREIAAATSAALHALARAQALTLNTLVLGAWALLLSRYSGQEDVVFGVTVAGRPPDLAGMETMVGLFINTLPLRVYLRGQARLDAWLGQLQAQQVELRQYEDSPLVAVQGWSGVPRTQPLFESIVVFENYPVAAAVAAPSAPAHLTIADVLTTDQDNYPLALVTGPGSVVRMMIGYDGRRFARGTITRMLGHLEQLLAQMVAAPEQPLAALTLLSAAERAQLLSAWNATTLAYPHALCLHQLFAAQVARTPDAIALVFDGRATTVRGQGSGVRGQEAAPLPLPTGGGTEGGSAWASAALSPQSSVLSPQSLTYAELNRRANQLAHYLQALGVGPEVLVALCMERSLEAVVGLLGILTAGGAYVPLDPSTPAARLAWLVQDSQAPILLTHTRLLPRLPASWALLVCLDRDGAAIAQQPATAPPSAVRPANLAYLIYTSGSTGAPKGVQVPRDGLGNLAAAQISAFAVRSDSRVLQFASLNFDASVAELWMALLAGATLVLPAADATLAGPALIELVREQAITTLTLPPPVLASLPTAAAPTLQTLVVAGESCSAELVARWASGRQMLNAYGPTEATVCATIAPIAPTADSNQRPPIGRPIANTRIYLLDHYAQPVPIGVPGEVYIGGVGLARGYLGRPDLTAERFVPNPFQGMGDGGWGMEDSPPIPHPPSPIPRLYKTGDRARYLPDGNIEFLGRMDRQVKVRGFRVEPGEIEALLGQHPAVRDAVVLAREDAPGDVRLVAYVVPKIEDRRLKIEDSNVGSSERLSSIFYPLSSELRDFLKQKLPDYMVPSAFVLLPALPLTPNGKVDRRALPAPDASGPSLESVFVAPRTPIEELLVQLWADVLRLERVGIQDNFFALGGHSLLATQVISWVLATFQVELPLRSLFEAPTVMRLAEQIEVARQGVQCRQAPPLRPVPRDEVLPLSFAQQRLWFLDQLQPNSSAYTIATAVRITGALDVAVMRWSLSTIMRRHEALRTSFPMRDGQPVQAIAAPRPLPLPLIDLHALPADERAMAAQQVAAAEARRSFDLARGPLLRATLMRLSDDEHAALLTMHHSISDAWSMEVLVREIGTLYAAFVAEQPSPLPELPIQYADYAVWQRDWLQGAVLEEQVTYWSAQLADLPVLQLSTDYPRPPAITFRGASLDFVLAPLLSKELVVLSRREGVTLFMAMLAAFQALLARYSGQDAIVVGTPIANRTRAETEGLIGFFVNTLVLRTDLSGAPTFREVLRRVREVCLEAYAHQDMPFEQIVDVLQPARDLSRNPLFQVMFTLQNAPVDAIDLPGLSLSPLTFERGTTHFDLSLSIGETRAGLAGSLEYSIDLFDRATIGRMLRHLETLLDGIVVNPDQRLAELPLLTTAERQQLLVEWNATTAAYPHDQCIHQLFAAQVASTPDAVAAVFDRPTTNDQRPTTNDHYRDKETRRQGLPRLGTRGDKETGDDEASTQNSKLKTQNYPNTQHPTPNTQHLTYDELNRRANQLAYHLRGLGVGPEVCVGICMERTLDLVVGLMGVLTAGGAYVPLDPAYPLERTTFMLADAGALLLLTQERLRARLSDQGTQIIYLDSDWESISRAAGEKFVSDVQPANLAFAIYTSGSTGQPKGTLIPHQALVNYTLAAAQQFELRSGDRVLQFASLSFDVVAEELFPTWLCGATVVLDGAGLLAPTAEFGRLIDQARVTAVELPAAYWHAWVDYLTWSGTPPASLRLVIIGCEKPSAERVATWQRFGVPLIYVYGLTETTITSTLYHLPMCMDNQAVSAELPIGRPIANTHVYLLDAQLQPVPVGVPGELYIGGVGLARGYRNHPELTAERFVPNPFAQGMGDGGWGMGNESSIPHPPSPIPRLYRTGDLARYWPSGNIEFLGRIDDQVKVRGYRIELGEIDAVLGQHPAVREVVVQAREDVQGEKRLVAYVVTSDKLEVTSREDSSLVTRHSLLVTQLRDFLRTRLPAYMIPSALVLLEALPLTPNGKVDRQALPVPATTRPDLDDAFVAPRTPTEQMLAQIWADVLHLERVGVHDDFFALGGHSLLSTQVIARVREAFQVELPLHSLFEAPSVAGLAECIEVVRHTTHGWQVLPGAAEGEEEGEV